ncbi:MAG: hypothetical protein RL768_458 [Nitrospirota bacterium]|jgi:hemoglobin
MICQRSKSGGGLFHYGDWGPSIYQGKSMLAAHKGMNIDHAEFMVVLDDTLAALDKNGVGRREQEEVLFVMYGMRQDIVLV